MSSESVTAETADTPFYARALFEQSPFSTVIYDARGHILAANAAFERFWGVSVASAPPGYCVLTDPELERQGALPMIRRAFAGERAVTPPVRYDISRLSTTGAGRTVWTEGHFYPVRDAEGRVTHVVLVHVDLTGRVEAEEALRVSEERFRTALRGSPVVTYSQDLELRYTWIHDAALGAEGAGARIGRRDRDLYERPEDAEAMEAVKRQVMRSGQGERREVLVFEGGAPRYFDLTVDPLRGTDGAIAGVICAQIDVTDRRRQDEERQRLLAATAEAAERTERLQGATAALGEALTLREVVEAALAQGMRALGTPAGGVYLLTSDGAEQELVSLALGGPLPEGWQRFPVTAACPVNDAVRLGEVVSLGSAAEWAARYPADAEPLDCTGVEAAIAAPLEVAGRVLGTIVYVSPAPRRFTGDERELMRAFARLAAQALERARLYEAERRARARAEEAAEALSMRARVLESMREGVSVTNEDGVIVYTNPAEDAMFGYERGGLVGQHVTVQNNYPPAENDRRVGEVIAQLKAVGEWVGEWENRRKDGTPFVTRARITAIELGGRPHWVCVQEDVTEQKRAGEALREAKEAAEKASRAKSDFLAVMSHELRTPLNAIAGYVDLLEMGVRGALSEGQRADLERIRLNQRRLLGLINDVLNYAKVDAGRVEYDIRPTPVREAFEATEPVIQPLAAAKGIVLEVEACDAALVAAADPDKLQQVLVNLLSNAVKFTEPGGRVMAACDGHDGQDEGVLRIRVRDTGVGIPADRLDAIFDPFVQVDTRLTRTAGGTGLGLAISRDLARGMGGELTARSEIGVGSEFTLTLPRALPRAKP